MPDIAQIAALLGGLVLLAVAGDVLVNGAVSAAKRLGISPLVAGIFIVGFGTSAPEMMVAVQAALDGVPDVALGNIVGSNIANVWLVLGLPALIAPLACGGYGQRRAMLAMLIATALWIGISAVMPLHAGVGAFFVLALVGYAIYTFRVTAQAKASGINVDVEGEDDPVRGWPITIVFLLAGLIGLPFGAHLIIWGGVGVAEAIGIDSRIIGLTMIAIGTSLPELGAGIAAAMRGRGSVIIGNVLGSNIFNILGAGGLVALFSNLGDKALTVGHFFHAYDHWAMAAAALTLALFIATGSKVSRLAGVLLLLIYALYIYGLTQTWDILALVGA